MKLAKYISCILSYYINVEEYKTYNLVQHSSNYCLCTRVHMYLNTSNMSRLVRFHTFSVDDLYFRNGVIVS